jgi:hypothetical protein
MYRHSLCRYPSHHALLLSDALVPSGVHHALLLSDALVPSGCTEWTPSLLLPLRASTEVLPTPLKGAGGRVRPWAIGGTDRRKAVTGSVRAFKICFVTLRSF